MSQLMFVGDPHGRYQHIVDAVQDDSPEAVVLLGDQCFEQPIDQLFASIDNQTSLNWIHGNHDTDKQTWFDNLFDSPRLEKSIHARVSLVANLRVAGLGGVFRGKIWDSKQDARYQSRSVWREAHSHKRFAQSFETGKRKHESTIWPEDYNHLAMFDADVLVLHEAPTSDRYGHQVLDDLAERLGVRLIVHGHHHRFYTDTLNNGIAVVGLGLAQIARMNVDAFNSANDNKEIFASFVFSEPL